MRRQLLPPFALLAAACGVSHERPRDGATTPAARAAVAPVAATVSDASDEPEVTGPPSNLAANDPWLAVADSAIRRHLASVLFGSKERDGFGDCSDDDGSDNPTIGAVAVSARPVRRTLARYEPFGDLYPMRRAEYDVEVKSVAILVPQWLAKFPTDTTVTNAYQYEARIGARTDTFSVAILQRADTAGHGRWEACDPTGPAVSEGDGPGFWFFDAVEKEPSDGLRIIHWVPAGGSWARIVAMADSARTAKGVKGER